MDLLQQGLITLVGAVMLGQSLMVATDRVETAGGRVLAGVLGPVTDAAVARVRGEWGHVLAALPTTWEAGALTAYATGYGRLDAASPYGGAPRAYVLAAGPGAVRILTCAGGGMVPPGVAPLRVVRDLGLRGVFIDPATGRIDGPALLPTTLSGVSLPEDCVAGAHVHLTAERATPDYMPLAEIPGLPTPMATDLDLGGNKITNGEEIVVDRVVVSGTLEAGTVRATGSLTTPQANVTDLRATSCSGC